mgnify:CR=1 FL=1
MLGYWKKYKTAHDTIRMLKEMQEQNIVDDYTCGLHNGIEICLAAIEDRQPDFKSCAKEPEVIEKKEQTGRTLFSGERRITNERCKTKNL